MKNIRTFNQFINESSINESKLDKLKDQLHLETNKSKAKKLKIDIGKLFHERTPKDQEDTGNHVLKKYRDTIGYWKPYGDTDVYEEDPSVIAAAAEAERKKERELPKAKSKWTYDQVVSPDWAEERADHAKKYPFKWNQREYDKWIKAVSGNGGWKHSHDMAQNATMEPGLIAWVERMLRKEYRTETPLERIQWDIENKGE